ncbi:MAG: hypothetical protein AAF743_14695, partial [Planctomycetota bacterium]
MLPRTPFDQLTAPRLSGLRDRLAKLIWQPAGSVTRFAKTSSTSEHLPVSDALGLTYEPVDRLPMTWGRKFDQCWWRVEIPEQARGGK